MRTKTDSSITAAASAALASTSASTRDRLIQEATRIFAEKGYTSASTREICQAADVNIASIHYYFGDKEGLYQAVLLKPVAEITRDFSRLQDPQLSVEDAMRFLVEAFLSPLMRGDDTALVMRVHLREMAEPTPMFRQLFEQNILPHHLALVSLLGRFCGVRKPDDGLHQLAFAIIALVNDYWMSRECMQILAPSLLLGSDVVDRLVGYSCALVDYEVKRRFGSKKAAKTQAKTMVKTAVKTTMKAMLKAAVKGKGKK